MYIPGKSYGVFICPSFSPFGPRNDSYDSNWTYGAVWYYAGSSDPDPYRVSNLRKPSVTFSHADSIDTTESASNTYGRPVPIQSAFMQVNRTTSGRGLHFRHTSKNANGAFFDGHAESFSSKTMVCNKRMRITDVLDGPNSNGMWPAGECYFSTEGRY